MIYNSKTRKLIITLMIIPILIGAGWFGVKVMSVDGDMSLDERIAQAFGWGTTEITEGSTDDRSFKLESDVKTNFAAITQATTENCTARYGYLMLINPQFKVEEGFIAARRSELVTISTTYDNRGLNTSGNDVLLDVEAAEHLNEMITAYTTDYPEHELQISSCFTTVETDCGQMCAEVGTSDYQTGLSCGLVDTAYGTELTNEADQQHPEWQWLRENSYRYGFIERYPETQLEEVPGGTATGQEGLAMTQDETTTESASEPTSTNADEQAELSRRWHYRYVGVEPATEIANGKYNNGEYDTLEHYLQARGLVVDLNSGTCE